MTTFKARGLNWIDAALVFTMMLSLLIGWACLASGCIVAESQIEACGRACKGAPMTVTYESCACWHPSPDGGMR